MNRRSLALTLLLLSLSGRNCIPADPGTGATSAMRRGLTLVTRAASNWQSNKTCFSCHHQTLPMLAAMEASRAGLAIDEAWLQSQASTTHAYFNERIDDMNAGVHVPGGSTTAGYGLWALSMAGRTADEATTAIITYLLKIQGTARLNGREPTDLKRLQDARWTTSCKRLPMQGSDVADTVLALVGMKQYATAEQQPAVARASAAAQSWLKQTPLQTQEDRIWRLWGLHHLEGDADAKRATRAVIFSAQHDDGGWSQTDDRESDAFSTGQTIFVLRQTGTALEDPAIQQARDYLLRTQLADGSWRVESHVKYKAQPYFENGDPHGEHQFLSTAATAWATAALAQLVPAQPTDLPRFWRTRLEHIEEAVHTLKKGTMNVLAETPGRRNVYLVTYGAADDRQGTANYNAAVGGRDPFSYARKDGTQKPVVFLLGPVHGQEVEGIAGLLNLLHVAETGRDLRGRAWDELAANLARCRVLIVPCGSPDARARCPYDSWVGEDYPVHERIGMGTRPDGSNHTWPFVKRIHPMRGAEVSTLGAYWNDNQVNLMHDEWFDPMTPETRAFFRLVRDEAPDFIVSLHTHAVAPEILQAAYVPWTVKRTLKDLGDRLQKRYSDSGLPHRAAGPEPKEDGTTFPPPYFNLCSALHHACGAVAFVHETPCGIRTPPYPQVNHDQLLDIQMLLYDELFRYAVEHPVNWQPAK